MCTATTAYVPSPSTALFVLPAAIRQLSCQLPAPLQSVISATICLLTHDLSTWQQSVNAVCQLSCNPAAQLQCVSSAAPWQLVNKTRHLSCQVSCNLSAELHPVSSDDICHLSCNV